LPHVQAWGAAASYPRPAANSSNGEHTRAKRIRTKRFQRIAKAPTLPRGIGAPPGIEAGTGFWSRSQNAASCSFLSEVQAVAPGLKSGPKARPVVVSDLLCRTCFGLYKYYTHSGHFWRLPLIEDPVETTGSSWSCFARGRGVGGGAFVSLVPWRHGAMVNSAFQMSWTCH